MRSRWIRWRRCGRSSEKRGQGPQGPQGPQGSSALGTWNPEDPANPEDLEDLELDLRGNRRTVRWLDSDDGVPVIDAVVRFDRADNREHDRRHADHDPRQEDYRDQDDRQEQDDAHDEEQEDSDVQQERLLGDAGDDAGLALDQPDDDRHDHPAERDDVAGQTRQVRECGERAFLGGNRNVRHVALLAGRGYYQTQSAM